MRSYLGVGVWLSHSFQKEKGYPIPLSRGRTGEAGSLTIHCIWSDIAGKKTHTTSCSPTSQLLQHMEPQAYMTAPAKLSYFPFTEINQAPPQGEGETDERQWENKTNRK